MLTALKASLRLDSSLDACVWTMVASAFRGMMRLGETTVTVEIRKVFHPQSHATRGRVNPSVRNVLVIVTLMYLSRAKAAAPGERQSIWLIPQGALCLMVASNNLAWTICCSLGETGTVTLDR